VRVDQRLEIEKTKTGADVLLDEIAFLMEYGNDDADGTDLLGKIVNDGRDGSRRRRVPSILRTFTGWKVWDREPEVG